MTEATVRAPDLPKGNHLIGEELISAASGPEITHANPSTGQRTSIAGAGRNEIDLAVETARAGAAVWRATPMGARRDALLRIAGLLRRDAETNGRLFTFENGSPSIVAPAMVGAAVAEWFDYYAGYADKLNGEMIPAVDFGYTVPEPYGVILAIVPWNGPLYEIGMKAAPALAAGNAVIIKAPELAPFTSIRFGQLCLEAGIPPGVVNVVTADPEGSAALVEHPGIDKISFTGSGPTAKQIMGAAAKNLTPVILELGGKSACLVFDDADIDAVTGAVGAVAMSLNSGQACVAPTRVLAHTSIYETVIDALAKTAQSLNVGDPTLPTTTMGPVITRASCDRILSMVDDAVRTGPARLVTGGQRLGGDLEAGNFLAPTIVADVDNASPLARTELFGPVVSVIPFTSEAEAVQLANASDYGLSSYIFTRDLARAHRLSAAMESGTVAVNGLGKHMVHMPFGGKKASGFGREGGRAGLEEFLSVKSVSFQL